MAADPLVHLSQVLDLAESLIEASGMAFGPEAQVPDDAAAEDRLAAFFGRQPTRHVPR